MRVRGNDSSIQNKNVNVGHQKEQNIDCCNSCRKKSLLYIKTPKEKDAYAIFYKVAERPRTNQDVHRSQDDDGIKQWIVRRNDPEAVQSAPE